jgi:CDP-glucose 4,6-dehydratase
VIQFGDIYRGRRVLVTGHTGFKGSWLALWLEELGAEVTGVSLDPQSHPNHWDLIGCRAVDLRQDIRDADAVRRLVAKCCPEIVFHLAAQPLVRASYRTPLDTWSTNVLGTAHVLEACRGVVGVRAVVAITTDKVYANQESTRPYQEDDRLGGHDPYSASKAACEILIESYRKAFFDEDGRTLVASARAGNVVGGGDWSEDRLLPDLIRALRKREALTVRSPSAIRPWQHVLEPLSGYLVLGQKLLQGDRAAVAAWNFGPSAEANRTVAEVLALMRARWPQFVWEQGRGNQPHEAKLLCLDSSKAEADLSWRSVWRIEEALGATAEWYQQYHEKGNIVSKQQLSAYVGDAMARDLSWVSP